VPLPWYIEYWYILPSIVATFCTVVLPFMYVRWLRKPGASEPQKLMRRLATFYKALAVVCFIPVISPSSWVGVSMAYVVLPIIFPPPTGSEGRVGGGAGIAMMLMFCFLFSLVLSLLCLETATWLLEGEGKASGVFVSMLFVASGIFALKSLYPDLLLTLHSSHYYWICILLYILANLNQTATNLVSVFYLIRPQVSKYFTFRSNT
jgi:hypothetical protein